MPKKDGSLTLRERNCAPECLGSEKRTNDFACILYPDDPKHERVLQMILRYPQMYRVVYILHDKDCWSKEDEEENSNHVAGTSKKAHYHVFIRSKRNTTCSAFSVSLGGVFVQAVSDPCSYLRYMIHDTPDSWDKFQYLPEAMKGDSKLIGMLAQRNDYYIQLSELCEHLDCEHNLKHVINYVAQYPRFQETFQRFQYLIVACAQQEERHLRASDSTAFKNNHNRGIKDE